MAQADAILHERHSLLVSEVAQEKEKAKDLSRLKNDEGAQEPSESRMLPDLPNARDGFKPCT